jgi:WD40 repeat protein
MRKRTSGAPAPLFSVETEPGAYRLTLSFDGAHALTESLSPDGWEFVVRQFDFVTGERTALALPLESYAAVRANDDGRTVLAERREERGVEIVQVCTGQREGRAPWTYLRSGVCPLNKAEAIPERVGDGAAALVCRGTDGIAYWSTPFPSSVRLLDAQWAGLVYVVVSFVDEAESPTLDDIRGTPQRQGIAVVDAPTGRLHRIIAGAAHTQSRSTPPAVLPSPDGLRALLSSGETGETTLVDLIQGESLPRPELERLGVLAAAFSPRGELLVTVDEAHAVTIWVDDGRVAAATFEPPTPLVGRVSVSFSGDGRRFALADAVGTALYVWELATVMPAVELPVLTA